MEIHLRKLFTKSTVLVTSNETFQDNRALILRQKKPRDCFTVVSYTTTEKNLYFSVSEVILVFHIAILREKPQLKYQRMVEINRKAFQIFQFLWSMIFFVFAILEENPNKNIREWWKLIEKPFKYSSFYDQWHSLFFLSYRRGASWSSRRKPGLDWQHFIRWEKQLNAFQKLFTCAEFARMMDRNYSICC